MSCGHKWQAVAETLVDWLECPGCHLVKGRFKYPHEHSEDHWQCGCGNDLFHVTVNRAYCPNCGNQWWCEIGDDA